MITEKMKMLAGELYNANYDLELIAEREQCKEICYDYNLLRPLQKKEKETIIRKLFARTGNNFLLEPSFYCDYGYNIEIGENFYSNHHMVILDEAKVIFGDNVFIGPNCSFYTACHPLDVAQRNEGLEYAKPINIGNNVWFGGNVTVLPGVTIGDNAVIGAGSVVCKDIPANVVAVGNPCKTVRKL